MNKFAALSILFLSFGAFAQPVGPAGCGLGNQIFGDQNQVLAATTNDTSGTQTFGISSGTSNCIDSSRMAQIENYVDVNRVALANDISRGQGETLSGLDNLMGCTNTSAVNESLKSNYSQIFPTQNARAVYVTRQIQRSIKESSARTDCHLG